MINIRTNIDTITRRTIAKIADLKDKERLLRSIAVQLTGDIRHRIHVDGEKSDGEQIGEYSSAYLRLRKKNNRGEDKKKILSLTRQMENDLSPFAKGEGYAIGFKNSANAQKAEWMEEQSGGTDSKNEIYGLSEKEKETIQIIVSEEVPNILK